MQGKFAKTTSYPMIEGENYYGTLKSDYDIDNHSYVCVLNPQGAKQLIKTFSKEKVIVIMIQRPYLDRVKSYLERAEKRRIDYFDEEKKIN